MKRVSLIRLAVLLVAAFIVSSATCCKHLGQKVHKVSTTITKQLENKAKVADIKTRIQTRLISDQKHILKKLAAPKLSRKGKRSTEENDMDAIIIGRKVNGDQKEEQKRYMCFCKEADCSGGHCKQQISSQEIKILDNMKRYENDDYEENISAEVENDAKEEENYVRKDGPTPTQTAEPTKINIPFSKNLNFNQRSVSDQKSSQILNRQIFPTYDNPPLQMLPSQPYPVYQYTPYIIPDSGIAYTGLAPVQENFIPAYSKTPLIKSEVPSIFARNFANVDECIKFFGRTACVNSSPVISSTASKVEYTDLSNDVFFKKFPGRDENIDNIVSFLSTTPNPSKFLANKIQSASKAIERPYITLPNIENYAINQNNEKDNNNKNYFNQHYTENIQGALSNYNDNKASIYLAQQSENLNNDYKIGEENKKNQGYIISNIQNQNPNESYFKSSDNRNANLNSIEIIKKKRYPNIRTEISKVNSDQTEKVKYIKVNDHEVDNGGNYWKDIRNSKLSRVNSANNNIIPRTIQIISSTPSYNNIKDNLHLSNTHSKNTLSDISFNRNSGKSKKIYISIPDHQDTVQQELQSINFNNSEAQFISKNSFIKKPPVEKILNQKSYDSKIRSSNPFYSSILGDHNALRDNVESVISKFRNEKLYTDQSLEPVGSNTNKVEQQINSMNKDYNERIHDLVTHDKKQTKNIKNMEMPNIYSRAYNNAAIKNFPIIETPLYDNMEKQKSAAYKSELVRHSTKNPMKHPKSINSFTLSQPMLHSNQYDHFRSINNYLPTVKTIDDDLDSEVYQTNKKNDITNYSKMHKISTVVTNSNEDKLYQAEESQNVVSVHTTAPVSASTSSENTLPYTIVIRIVNSDNNDDNFQEHNILKSVNQTASIIRHGNIDLNNDNSPVDNSVFNIKNTAPDFNISDEFHNTSPSPFIVLQNLDSAIPSQTYNLQEKINIQSPESYNLEKVNNNEEHIKIVTNQTAPYYNRSIRNEKQLQSNVKTITSLKVSENNDYKNDKQTVKISNLKEKELIRRNTGKDNINKSVSESTKSSTSKFSPKTNNSGTLYVGTEKVILKTKNISDSLEGKIEKSTVNILKNTETSVQSVDERPTIDRELESKSKFKSSQLNTIIDENVDSEPQKEIKNQVIVQNALKKVINNFVPGKAKDLIANYGVESISEMGITNKEDLLPEILDTPFLKKLLAVPEIEDMVTHTTSDYLSAITGMPVADKIPDLIKHSLHDLIDRIPYPHPTVAPMTSDDPAYMNGDQITEPISLFEKTVRSVDKKNPPKEVFDKLKNIINKSALGEQAVSQPIVQNLIIKAVKHSLDQERGVIDESTIRQAFNTLIPAKPRSKKKLIIQENVNEEAQSSDKRKPIILHPNTTALSGDTYKEVSLIPVTENVLLDEQSTESSKNLLRQSKHMNPDFSEDKEKISENKLKNQKINEADSKLIDNCEDLESMNAASTMPLNHKYFNEKSVDGSIERKPIKYYSPNDRILEYIKNHPNNPCLTTTAEIVGKIDKSNEEKLPHQTNEENILSLNIGKSKPATNKISPPITKNYSELRLPEYSTEEIKDQFNQIPKSEEMSVEIKTDSTRQIHPLTIDVLGSKIYKSVPSHAYSTDIPTMINTAYLGKLIPMNYETTTQSNNLDYLKDSNLMYIGDNVKLPLTIRKMKDDTFALTLSNEMCKHFIHRICPCCIPNSGDGIIVREKRNGEIIPELNFSDEDVQTTTHEYMYEQNDPGIHFNFHANQYPRDVEEIIKTTSAHSFNRFKNHRTNGSRLIKILNEMVAPDELLQEHTGKILLADLAERANELDAFNIRTKKYNNEKEQNESTKILKTNRSLNNNNFDETMTLKHQFSYQKINPLVTALKNIQKGQNTRNTRRSYMYQQYADEDMTVSGRTQALKNVLHWIKNVAAKKN